MAAESVVVVTTTTGDRAEAEAIARTLIEERLAACVQLVPISSIYRWKGEIEAGDELRLEIKTRADLATAVERRIRALHSYDLPEVVTVPVTCSAEYAAWIAAETD